jgi:lysophospholipase L1-like esterase
MPSREPLPAEESFAVVGYGDSLTRGEFPEDSYLEHLPTAWATTNRGKSGEFAISGHPRLQGAIPALIEHGVEVVVMMWGTKDAYSPIYDLQGPTQWRDDVVAKTGASLDQLVAAGITPVLVVPPPSLDPSPAGVLANLRLEELEWLLAEEAAARDVAFVSLYTRMLAEPDPVAFFQPDGVHLNATGAAFVARQLEPIVAPLHEAWLAAHAAP